MPHDARRSRHSALSPRHETRSLATQADIHPSHMSSIPFDSLLQPWSPQSAHSQRPSTLEPWNLTPLIIRETTEPPTSNLRFGIGGDPIELYQNLHACLRVGRMDRATAIVQRLTAMYNPTALEVVEAHNAYLQTMFELAKQNPEEYSMATIEAWYDTHIIRKAIEPNAGIFVTLLRASLTLLKGSERDRSLRKYLAMAERCGSAVLDEINSSEDFDDVEWDALIRAQPGRFKEPVSMEEHMDSAQEYYISTPLGAKALMEHGIIANPAHTVREIAQKGEGLKMLKTALSVFDEAARVPYPYEMGGSQEEKDRAHAYMRQLQIERDGLDAATDRWKVEDEKLQRQGVHGVLKAKPIQALMWNWYSALLPRIKDEVALAKGVLSAPSKENARDSSHIYGPYLEQLKPEKLTALTVSRILHSAIASRRNSSIDMKIGTLSGKLADDIQEEVRANERAKVLAQKKKERKQARQSILHSLTLQPQHAKPVAEENVKFVEPPADSYLREEMPTTVKARIGVILIEHFLQAATITITAEDPKTGKNVTSTHKAFHHQYGFLNGKKTAYLIAHDAILEKLTKEPSFKAIQSVRLPMVFEPKPWTGYTDGGYYTSSHPVVRSKNGDLSQRAYAESAIANGDLKKILKGIDVLSKVPWKINKDVFNVMVEAWNAGEGIGAMVAAHDNPPPEEPPADASDAEKFKWRLEMNRWEKARDGFHSQRTYQNYQLETARAYVNEKKLYFPHSVDFRGRAYPIAHVLNHMGSDFSRCLLMFANGKELGSGGLHWLKVHLANLYGFDKASLREREQFVMDNLQEVYDSAANPLSGRRWWTKAEDPWQCLGCCIELRNALESPDPTRFISHLPIHQDGTCNGLQHYAALGGDYAGARQVNLEPSDRPQDIYTGVADLVKEMIEKDAADGNRLAVLLKGKITRKVVKRTVMTNVYGVTFIGAKAQVEDQLRGIYQRESSTTEIWHASGYVTRKIFEALGKIFNGAQEIQYWLGECGERILTSISPAQIQRYIEFTEGKPVAFDPKYKNPKHKSANSDKKILKEVETFKTPIIWTTPLRMPVVQPYRKNGSITIKTKLQDVILNRHSTQSVIDKRKQLQAFPPNFIHSLDATHMMLSALKCSEIGLDFAAVHDSFWTHAADIPNLNVVLRDAFVRMHSEDIISRLAAEFKTRYAGSMYKSQMKCGSAVAKKIVAWRVLHNKKNSQSKEAPFDELRLEAKRQELLKSKDPSEREQGLNMVTPTSIWLANQDPESVSSYRLSLLGETKNTGGRKFDEAKDKVLTAEAEQVTEELEAAGTVPKDIDEAAMAAAEVEMKDSKQIKNEHPVKVWLPLTFPPVPKKGGWDVSRLRESQYFFS